MVNITKDEEKAEADDEIGKTKQEEKGEKAKWKR